MIEEKKNTSDNSGTQDSSTTTTANNTNGPESKYKSPVVIEEKKNPSDDPGTQEQTTTTTTKTTMSKENPGNFLMNKQEANDLTSAMKNILQGADRTLEGLEADRDLLPAAILRKCREFADGLGSLAEELENQSSEERKSLAGAIQNDLKLFEQQMEESNKINRRLVYGYDVDEAKHETNPQMSNEHGEGDILLALSGASTLLRDVETSFREIGNDEAEEIADAALLVARLFLLSLQNVHSNLVELLEEPTGGTRLGGGNSDEHSAIFIEELPGDETEANGDKGTNNGPTPGAPRAIQGRRMRVLWPPLGPTVDTAMAWTREEASKRPVLAVALGLSLWPVAISTALLGTSVALVDGAVQNAYERFQHGPWISVLEESAAQAYQTIRLTVATGKLVGKQSLRVAARQIERRGGLGPIAQDVGGMALDRIIHPIDTIGKIWDGFQWGLGVAKETAGDFLSMQKERSQASLI